jgi:hypothetical protein
VTALLVSAVLVAALGAMLVTGHGWRKVWWHVRSLTAGGVLVGLPVVVLGALGLLRDAHRSEFDALLARERYERGLD